MNTKAQRCATCGKEFDRARLGALCPSCIMGVAMAPVEPADPEPDPDELAGKLSPDPLEGITLGLGGRYKILQRIGEGGFGTVYMAEQTSPVRRRVAVKILKAGMDTRQVVARFEAERQALAVMDHPNIAKVLDGGETDHGRSFFVMELVRGTPLTDFCDREKLDPTARLHLFLKVCRAVQHAHQKGIIHRDLKPGNILVTIEDGNRPTPKIIDFGVAKAMEADLTDKTLFTRFEQMIGTPAYMSPEQAGANAAANDIDTRADIYALGVLLYELLTGSTPFDSNTLQSAAFEEVRRILREEEVPKPSARFSSLGSSRRDTLAHARKAATPQTLDRQLRGDLDWIVMHAIEKDRSRRYETANALALDLERFLDGAPVEARPPTATYRLQKFARRHKTALATAAAILLTLVVATTVSIIAAFQAAEANKRANKNYSELRTAYTDLDTSRQETERQRNEALWNQYVARQFPIRQAWEQRNFGHLERLLDELVPERGQPDFRGWEWSYYKDQCDQAFVTFEGRFPTWNPKGSNLAVVRDLEGGGSAIVLVSPIDGSPIRTIAETPRNEGNRINNLRWSADGSRITYLTFRDHAVVLDASSGTSIFRRKIPTPKREAPTEGGEVSGLDLSHDGKVLVTGTWAGNIQMWDVDKEQPQRLLQPADNNSQIHAHALRFDPGNHHLVAALRYGRRSSWNLETGERFEYERQSDTSSGTVAWNRSGSCFAVTDTDIGSVAIYQLNQSEPLATLPHPSVEGLSWIGDERLASLGSDQMVRIWDTGLMEMVTAFQIIAEPDYYRWSPVPDTRGKLLAVPTNGEVKIVRLKDPVKPYTVLDPDTSSGSGKRHQIEWDRKGHQVASVQQVMVDVNTYETKLRVWGTRSESLLSKCKIKSLRGLGWRADQSAVLVVELGGRLLEADIRSGEVTILGASPEPGSEQPSAFSTNGRWLILGLKDGARCIDQHTQQLVSTWSAPEGLISLRSSRWDHSSRLVALLYWNHLVVWNPFGGKVSITPRQKVQFINHAWSPDGHFIAVGCRDGQWVIFDANSLQEVASLSGHRGAVLDLDWSANGRIATASEDGTIRIWDDATGDELLAFQHPDDRKFLSVRWTHDGRRLAAGDDQGRVFIWGSTGIQPRPDSATGLASGIIAREGAGR